MESSNSRLYIYSETGRAFLNRAHIHLRDILSNECAVTLKTSRFFYKNRSIPLSLVLFEKTNELGFFDRGRYQIGLSKSLIYRSDEETIKDILRHEIAHLFTFLDFGDVSAPHGEEFKKTCQRLFFSSDVAKATLDITESAIQESNTETFKIIEKVKKLMRLASSNNLHESAIATAKANELLLNHNLSLLLKEGGTLSDDTHMMRVLTFKKNSPKLSAISKILEKFYVKTITSYGYKEVAIEVIGTECNVLFADYVAKFLDVEFETLYKSAKKINPALNGARAKNSFMSGIAEGYLEKIAGLKTPNIKVSTALIYKDLDLRLNEVYPRLSRSYSEQRINHDAHSLGKASGQQLNINRPISSSQTRFLLT